jgi:polyphosphate kinase
LDRRIELLTPIEDIACKRRLMEILDTYFRDNQNAWALQHDGRYQRLQPGEGQPKFRGQKVLYQSSVEAVRVSEQAARNRFEPHRPAVQ